MSPRNSNKTKEPKAKKEPKVKKEKTPKVKKVKEKVAKVKESQKVVPTDRYTLILLFAFLAMVAACVMLYLDLASYK